MEPETPQEDTKAYLGAGKLTSEEIILNEALLGPELHIASTKK